MHFTESHEWVRIKDHIATIGMTDYAQRELGEVVYIELPKVDQKIKMGQEVCVIESTKAAADVYAPISGKIIAVNASLKNSPSLINQAAENEGWLFQIEISDPKELEHLMTEKQYRVLIS